MQLNERAAALIDALLPLADELRIECLESDSGAMMIDCGINIAGGLRAGCALSEASMADLGHVAICQAIENGSWGPRVQIVTDHPVLACLASQYAGWRISDGNYFGMLSGPIRAAARKEPIFERIAEALPDFDEVAEVAVGVIEGRKIPPAKVCADIAKQVRIAPEALTLLLVPTASLAGAVQVVARSVETAIHKMAELGFDLGTLESAHGIAPLPPIGRDDLAALGRTNDAILYGGEVTIWTRGADAQIEELGPRIPSSSSSQFGRPFGEIFAEAGHDFYKIDPLLFSPAVINLVSYDSGKCWRFGKMRLDVLDQSFGD
ncbi:MAG: methenyltetrahydromethanopterin cyclohydrolase [Planctomycetaceae bacterium]|nr:methenyltetrahydromethanopterin cyclohydrolase [Planctomycetaceae bacterium]